MGSRLNQDKITSLETESSATTELESVNAINFDLREDKDREISLKNIDIDKDAGDPFLGCRHRARNCADKLNEKDHENNGTSANEESFKPKQKSSKTRRENREDRGSGSRSKMLEKRKINDVDEDALVLPTERKRKFQLDNKASSLSSGSSEDGDNPRMLPDSILDDISTQEISELRAKLEEGYFAHYFSMTFWKTLHDNHGSTLGYTFGFLIILFLNHEWMLEEFADENEGHSVAKTFVILFVIYSYTCITMGLEFVQLVLLLMGLYFPRFWRKCLDNFKCVLGMNEKLKKFATSKYFYTPFVVLWCVFTGLMGSVLWKWFWWNHICKSYHDRTCRGSWLGKLVINYRDEACYDGTATSVICERFVSYAPIMVFSVFFVFLGNVLMPLLNDRLSLYYPLSEDLETAFELMELLNNDLPVSNPDEISTVPPEFSPLKKNMDFSPQASDTKVIHFGGFSSAAPMIKETHEEDVQLSKSSQLNQAE